MSQKKIEDYSKISSGKNVKHIVDEEGKGWFCYCGQSGEVESSKRHGCCSSEGGADFERVG